MAKKTEADKATKVAEVATMEDMHPKDMANSIDMASNLHEKRMYAVQMISSGLLPNTLATPDQLEDEEYREKAIGAVIAVVEYGRELKITPWVALHGMHVVQGKVVMGVHMYMGLALKNNILVDVVQDYVRIYKGEGSSKTLIDVHTTVEITRKYAAFDGLVKSFKFTKRWSEIKKAGLDTRDNYKRMPALMLRTRCITEALRLYAADVFMGTYEMSEMLDVTDTAYTISEDGQAVYAEDAK